MFYTSQNNEDKTAKREYVYQDDMLVGEKHYDNDVLKGEKKFTYKAVDIVSNLKLSEFNNGAIEKKETVIESKALESDPSNSCKIEYFDKDDNLLKQYILSFRNENSSARITEYRFGCKN